MTDILRAALSADEDTPAGVDVAAVRARAGRLRRARYAVAGAAAVTALAVLVPVAVLQRDRATTTAAPAPVPALTCPGLLPDAPRDRSGAGDLLPGPVTGALVCDYAYSGIGPAPTGRLSGTARLSATEATALAARLAAAPPPGGNQVCTSEFALPFGLRFAGDGWTRTLRVEPYGCAAVDNGTVTRLAAADKTYLQQLAGRARR
jgi:transposase InsO family protein